MGMLEEHEHRHAVHNFDGIIENRVTTPPPYFTVLFYGLVVWGVIFCAYYLLSGWSSEQEFRQEMAAHQREVAERQPEGSGGGAPAAAADKEVSEEDRVATGEKLYAQHCAACHGQDAGGGIGPSLKDQQFRYGGSKEALTTSIDEGRPEGMPGFGNQLSGDQIESLVAFIQSLAGPARENSEVSVETTEAGPDKEKSGEQSEGQQTARADEDGEAQPAAEGRELFAQHCAACHGQDAGGGIGPSLKDQQFRYGGSEEALTTSIGEGRPGGMPGFGNQLSGDQIESLVAFIRSL